MTLTAARWTFGEFCPLDDVAREEQEGSEYRTWSRGGKKVGDRLLSAYRLQQPFQHPASRAPRKPEPRGVTTLTVVLSPRDGDAVKQ
jgi:hypothetical protein